jgi:multidrug efflux pump subunit AcrA (membrane-fusion protein)
MNQTSRKAITILEVVFARLRFVAVFVVAALIVGYWDNIKNHWDKWTRPSVAPDSLAQAAASDIEFYCPMHPEVIRSQQGQCPRCGMPLVKRKKGQAVQLPPDVLARVTLTPRRKALANVQTTPVEFKELTRDLRSVGVLDYDETRLAHISARVGGRADELYVQYTGQAVNKGDPVYSIYSPDVYTAQREYLLARRRVNEMPKGSGDDAMTDATAVYNASLQKLVLWGVGQDQLDKLDEQFDRTGKVPTHLVVTSPIGGIVVKKNINGGDYVQVGDRPYTVADLNTLWLQLKLYERDVPLARIGDPVEVVVEALPNEVFEGTITFKSFQLDPETRTLDARVEVNNPDLRLRPGMFASARVRVPVVVPPVTTNTAAPPETPGPATAPAVATAPADGSASKTFVEALQSYFQAHKLLSEDKSEGVERLLAQLVERLKPLRDFPAAAVGYERLAAAVGAMKDPALEAVREHFKEVSAAMIEIGKAVGTPADGGTVRVFRCPMKKANWLQLGADTANPYYGSKMYDCGGAVESLPKNRPEVPKQQRPAAQGNRALAVPRSAVIDTGENKIVYVESSPGIYDMRAVRLGPVATASGREAADEFYPVLGGLDEGDQVVTVGTFLVDAENRLNPSRAAPVGDRGAATPAPTGHQGLGGTKGT